MISALWLAVSLLSQDTAPLNPRNAAEVVFLSATAGSADPLPVPIQPTAAKPGHRNVRVLILTFSSKSLAVAGERASLRVKDPNPVFQVTLPAGIEADDVRVLRLKPKDGRRSVGYHSSPDHPFSKDDVVTIKLEPVDPARRNVFRVVTAGPLPSGEYALLADLRFFEFGIN